MLVLAADHRAAFEQGLTNAAARHQGDTLLVALLIVCAGVALAQAGVGLAVRHGTPPRWLTFTRDRARILAVTAVTVCVVVAVLAGASARLSHAWQDFKHPSATALHQDSIARFGTVSGNGRYDYWKVAVDTTGGHLLGGSGAGTYQLLWTPRAPYFSYVQNAHSLYLETLAETGIVGLVLLAAFLLVVLGATARLCIRARYEARVRAAGLAGALIAFLVAAASDWIWRVPALPAAFLLLTAAVLAPATGTDRGPGRRVSWSIRLGAVAIAGAALIAIAIPLATVSTVRQSQSAVVSGDPAQALADARTAVRLSRAPPRRRSSSRSYSSFSATSPARWRLPATPPRTSQGTGAPGSSSRACRPRPVALRPRSPPTSAAALSTPDHPCSSNDRRTR